MFYFTHPQLKLSWKNIVRILKSFALTPDLESLNKRLSFWLPNKQFVFTDMGRTAFRFILKQLNLRNCQVMLPAYICDIFEPILKEFNITPIFLDIDLKTFNINLEQIRQKINPQVKAIVISHTYGLPNDMASIRQIINPQTIIIEDFAHAFGAKQDNGYIGNFGQASFYSLYKQFPTLRGGLAVLPSQSQSPVLATTSFGLRDLASLLNYFSFFAFLFKKFGNQVAPRFLRKEKQEQISGLNNVSLNLFSLFLDNFEQGLQKRIALAAYFQNELAKLGFAVQQPKDNVFTFLTALVPEDLFDKREAIVKALKKRRIFCTRIWHTPIALNPDQFPNTAAAAQRAINFPLQNHYKEKDVNKMIARLKLVLNKVRAQ